VGECVYVSVYVCVCMCMFVVVRVCGVPHTYTKIVRTMHSAQYVP
jgi:transcription initiation factor TFIIIB Brf1 subunit/transcription initiation factor TFIIB